MAVISVIRIFVLRLENEDRRPGVALLIALLSTLLMTFAISFAKPLWLPRYLIICLPSLLLFCASSLRGVRWRFLGPLAMVPILVSMAVSVQQTISLTNDDLQTATTYVMNRSSAEDGIAFRPSYLRMLFDYYRRRSARVQSRRLQLYLLSHGHLLSFRIGPRGCPSVVESSLHDGERLWLVTLPNQTEDVGDLRAGRITSCLWSLAKPPFGERT